MAGYNPYFPATYQPMAQQYQQPMQGTQMSFANQPQQQQSGLIWVQGEAGAKSYLVAPGQTVMLMDSESQKFYLKSADQSGMPLPLRTFAYSEMSAAQPVRQDMGQYVTREELETRLAALVPKEESHEPTV